MLEAVPLLSYEVPMETKVATELVTAEWWQTVPDCTISSRAAQDAQKATGLKMLLCYCEPCKTGLKFAVDQTWHFRNNEFFQHGIELAMRDAIAMNIALLFHPLVDCSNGGQATGICSVFFLSQILSTISLSLLLSYLTLTLLFLGKTLPCSIFLNQSSKR